ncbi:MAG: nucleoside 2-deoxyribosyltransferase [Muribaculaceae bacterium]|nr:nucleoside 2-deoxyribosyltransferase [Muribaculaceae bacterium]
MKIYFAGSIRGGRVDAELYRRIISHMQQMGHVVLTEHVGSGNLCLTEQGRDRDAAIYEQDTAWLRESDVVIAECTCPSLGVGYELAYAERFEIPVHIFYNPSKCALSAMLTGDSYFHIHPYEKEEDIFTALNNIL